MLKIKKILCPVDLLPGSEHPGNYAAGLAAVHPAKLDRLHVGSPMIPAPYAEGISTVDLTRSMEQAAIRQMTRLVARVKAKGTKAQGSVMQGQIKDAIAHVLADLKPDLVTMGTHNK